MAYTNKAHGSTAPSTNFATRVLGFYSIAFSGAETSYSDIGSNFQKAVQGVQQVAELYAVGTPAGGAFMVVVSDDTVTREDGQSIAQSLDAAVSAATNASVTVTEWFLSGAGLDN
jgi:hypothetical protein